MRPVECSREEDVQAAVNTGRWPERVDSELRAHIDGCEVCQDVLAVAIGFASVDGDAHPLPDASAVWLRSQVRARAEAARLAQQPITVAQALAFASVVGVLGALVGASSSWLQTWLKWAGMAVSRLNPRGLPLPTGIAALVTEHAGLVVMIAMALTLAPIAVYWAIREN